MSPRVLRKKARTPKVPTRPVTAVTWGKPAKEPYPPDQEQYALMGGGGEEGKVLEIKPFPAFTWWRRQTGPKPQKASKVPKTKTPKTSKVPKTSSSQWWRSKPAVVPSAATMTAPRPLPTVTPQATEPIVVEETHDPWQHHSHYFPEYTPVRPELSTSTPAYISKVTPYPVLPDFESFGVTVWQPSMHSTVYAPMVNPSSAGQGGVIGRSGK